MEPRAEVGSDEAPAIGLEQEREQDATTIGIRESRSGRRDGHAMPRSLCPQLRVRALIA